MKNYRVTIMADRYPMSWDVTGSSYSVAVARALRLWQKRFKGSRAGEMKITVVRYTPQPAE